MLFRHRVRHDNLVVHQYSFILWMSKLDIDITVEEHHEVAGNLVNVTRVLCHHTDVKSDINWHRSKEVVVPILASHLILDFIVK